MTATLDANIDFFIKNGFNVLFRGRHGTGKTARILQAFQRANLKYQYFSASTMDPWVDFIGIPKEKVDKNGKSFLELIRPEAFSDDSVEAIFLDEYNRAPKKVRNAVMELIQFKAINGKKFPNLKIVWAAINPEEDGDDKYDVEALDPAQIDRFHALIEVPFKPDLKYFKGKYDEMTATAAVTWWSELEEKNQRSVSPRRLDYALEVYTKGGDVRFVLTNEALNVNKLLTELANGPISANLKKFYDAQDATSAKTFLAVENNYSASSPYIVKKREYTGFFVPLLTDERIITLMTKNKDIEEFIFTQADKFTPLITDLSRNPSSKLARRAATIVSDMERQKLLKQQLAAQANGGKLEFSGFFNGAATLANYVAKFTPYTANKPNLNDTIVRVAFYKEVESNMPKEANLAPSAINKVVFDSLFSIAITSHLPKINKDMPHLIGMLNHLLKLNPEFKTLIKGRAREYAMEKHPNLWIV